VFDTRAFARTNARQLCSFNQEHSHSALSAFRKEEEWVNLNVMPTEPSSPRLTTTCFADEGFNDAEYEGSIAGSGGSSLSSAIAGGDWNFWCLDCSTESFRGESGSHLPVNQQSLQKWPAPCCLRSLRKLFHMKTSNVQSVPLSAGNDWVAELPLLRLMIPAGGVATATPFTREVGGMGLEATDVSAGAGAADAAGAGVAGVAGVGGDAEGGEVGGSEIPEQDDLLHTTTPKTEPKRVLSPTCI
jgi:hypothetical protein